MTADSALFSLLAGYLNIDWDEDYSSSRDAVIDFLHGERRGDELAEEIDTVLALDLDDEELARHIESCYDPGIRPEGEGYTWRGWLQATRKLLDVARGEGASE